MRRSDLVLVAAIIIFFIFAFRTQIIGFFFGPGMGGFEETGDEVCTENGKAILYLFGSNNCSHTVWEKSIIEDVISEFEDYVSLHENLDSNEDKDILMKYSSAGGSPFIVIGCKFERNGSGEGIGEVAERQVLRNLICQVTDSPLCE